ncbi:hypothetical protein EDB19DRAFT_1958338 [Suillus lakei]|nr:hypothetical protein EDB19DRAFT_1958338 [Suillus lakei]
MSSNNSKNSKSSEVSPLNDGALLEFAPGMAFMPLEALDMVFAGWEGARGGMVMNSGFGMGGMVDVARVVGMIKVSGGIRGSVGVLGSNTAGLRVNVGSTGIAGNRDFLWKDWLMVSSSKRDDSDSLGEPVQMASPVGGVTARWGPDTSSAESNGSRADQQINARGARDGDGVFGAQGKTLYSYFVEGDTIFVGRRKTFSKRIITEQITISSRTLPVLSSKLSLKLSSTNSPSYSLSINYVQSTSGGKSLLTKGRTHEAKEYSAFFDEKGMMAQEVFK